MEAVRIVRTEKLVASPYKGREKPKFKVGQWLKISCGRDEGHSFVVRAVRFNLDTDQFEYWREALFANEWLSERNLTSDHRNRHYDSQGYCDNPGRGY